MMCIILPAFRAISISTARRISIGALTAYYKKALGGFLLFVFSLTPPIWGLGELPSKSGSPEPGYYAYSIQYGLRDNEHPVAFLDKIDIRRDEIVDEMEIDAGWNDLSLEPDGNVILTQHRPGMEYGRQVSRYYPRKKKLRFLFNTETQGITRTFPIKDKLFLAMYIFNPAKNGSGIEVFSTHPPRQLKSLYFGDEEQVYSEICASPDKKKIVAASEAIRNLSTEGESKIFVIDTEKEVIEKVFDLSKTYNYGYVSDVALSLHDKLYVATICKAPGRTKALNNELYVFSLKDFKLLKKIPISAIADRLVYVKALNRLYVKHSAVSTEPPPPIEVIDCATDRVIGKIKGPQLDIRSIKYVGNYKLYASTSGIEAGKEIKLNPGILVIDLKKNKVIKKIPGNFAPISINLDPVDDIIPSK